LETPNSRLKLKNQRNLATIQQNFNDKGSSKSRKSQIKNMSLTSRPQNLPSQFGKLKQEEVINRSIYVNNSNNFGIFDTIKGDAHSLSLENSNFLYYHYIETIPTSNFHKIQRKITNEGRGNNTKLNKTFYLKRTQDHFKQFVSN